MTNDERCERSARHARLEMDKIRATFAVRYNLLPVCCQTLVTCLYCGTEHGEQDCPVCGREVRIDY